MDVETAVEIHRKAIQDSIPDERVSTTLVPELEFKHWKKNGASLLSYPVGLAFSPKHSRLFITDRCLHAVFMVDMHCPANVTLIAGGGEPGHINGYGNKARFRNPAGIAVKESGKLYICDQGNGRVRVVNLRTLFCHASQIVQGSAEESQSEEEDCAGRRIRKVHVHDLSLISEGNVPDLVSPFAICASAKGSVELFVSDVGLGKIFSISAVVDDDETNCVGQLNELFCFDRSSLLTSLALTRDEQYLLVGDGNGSCIHLCQVRGRLKLRTISNIPGLMGIAVTDGGTVFLSSSKEHALFSLKEEEMLGGKETLTKVCGETAGHRDGVQSRWNKPTALCVYRNTVFVCDTGNLAIRMLTSAKGLIPLQSKMAQYANVFRLDKKAKEEDLPRTFEDHVKSVEELVAFLSNHEQEALEGTGKRNTNGPDMTIPRCTRQSFLIVLESLTSLTNTLAEIGHSHLLDRICFESMTTLGVECYSKGMRADHDMSTISHISLGPIHIIKGEPPNIKTRPNKLSAITEGTGSKEEDTRRETVMREFAKEYGRGVRQENVRSKTKELTGTLPYALSMCPTTITASLEESEDVTTACQVISPFWLAVLLEDVQIEANGGNFVQQRVSLKWLNQTSDSLTYTSGDVCNGNSPKCILTRVLDFSSDGSDIILTTEEDNRLCRIANGDYGDDDDNENETAPPTAEDEGEVSLPIRLPGVNLSGRRTTRFILR
ncbi:unnamed protein product [Porites lobata]|uniref:NHL repeat-containing protein n=1 Tax=Porites lobata TaxID=104759 RepID=A0ABN8QIM3_9CNID|nr:unnamed protein product [Porites lobata]